MPASRWQTTIQEHYDVPSNSSLEPDDDADGEVGMKKSARAHAAEIINALQNQQSNLDALLRKHTKILVQMTKNCSKRFAMVCVVNGFIWMKLRHTF